LIDNSRKALHMRYYPYASFCSVFVSALLGACVMPNPSWDPPTAAETGDGSDEELETSDGAESDPDMSNEGSEFPGDGDGDGDSDEGDSDEEEEGTGDGDGDGQVCGHASASFGPCPGSCDKCEDGVCWRYCSDGECHDDFLLCPVSWSCHVVCIGKDSCRDMTLACSGWGTCDLECLGDNACTEADVLCSAGPCSVTCGAGHYKPCEHLDVECGGNKTKLHCEEPYEGFGPKLSNEEFAECGCSSDCVQKDDG
jgi:hypothetical protein